MILPSFLHFCPIAPAVSEMFEPLPLWKQQVQWCKVEKNPKCFSKKRRANSELGPKLGAACKCPEEHSISSRIR